MKLLYVLFLSTALGMDALVSGVAYGLKGIHVPLGSLIIVGIVTVICTAIAMGGTYLLGGLIDIHAATIAGAALLVALGAYRLLLDFVTKDIALHEGGHHVAARKLTFSVGALVIRIMAKPEAADIDQSKHISPMEAVFLGLALGADNMVASSAGTLGGLLPIYTPIVMGAVQVALIAAGIYGCKWLIDHRVRFRLPYLAGTVLVVLGLVQLI